MHFKLICLYQDGVAIDKDKLAASPTYVGNLVVEDWVEGNAFQTPDTVCPAADRNAHAPCQHDSAAVRANGDQDDCEPDDATGTPDQHPQWRGGALAEEKIE